jgi:hypothetical protein
VTASYHLALSLPLLPLPLPLPLLLPSLSFRFVTSTNGMELSGGFGNHGIEKLREEKIQAGKGPGRI